MLFTVVFEDSEIWITVSEDERVVENVRLQAKDQHSNRPRIQAMSWVAEYSDERYIDNFQMNFIEQW